MQALSPGSYFILFGLDLNAVFGDDLAGLEGELNIIDLIGSLLLRCNHIDNKL